MASLHDPCHFCCWQFWTTFRHVLAKKVGNRHYSNWSCRISKNWWISVFDKLIHCFIYAKLVYPKETCCRTPYSCFVQVFIGSILLTRPNPPRITIPSRYTCVNIDIYMITWWNYLQQHALHSKNRTCRNRGWVSLLVTVYTVWCPHGGTSSTICKVGKRKCQASVWCPFLPDGNQH